MFREFVQIFTYDLKLRTTLDHKMVTKTVQYDMSIHTLFNTVNIFICLQKGLIMKSVHCINVSALFQNIMVSSLHINSLKI